MRQLLLSGEEDGTPAQSHSRGVYNTSQKTLEQREMQVGSQMTSERDLTRPRLSEGSQGEL